MLELILPKGEIWDEERERFIYYDGTDGKTIQLEHSLISLKKWEEKWHKPFLGKEEKTYSEICDYVRCMTITKGIPDSAYYYIPADIMNRIVDYIQDPMTATWFTSGPTENGTPKMGGKEVITAEIIYYWMISLNIPPEYQKWHLNQLMTLIKVVSIKNTPSKKMSKKDITKQNAALNAQRRAKYKTKG